MTVSSATAVSRYTGDGSTTKFSPTWLVYDQTHIEVLVDDTVQTLGSDYTVANVGPPAGFDVTFTTAPASGTTVTIKRNMPFTQTTDYVENDSFAAETHEQALDYRTMEGQQLKEELDRAIKLAKSSTLSGVELPEGADKIVKWNAAGTDLEVVNAADASLVTLYAALTAINALTPAADKLPYYTGASSATLTTLTAFGRSLIDDANASAARTTLGLGTAATKNTGTGSADVPTNADLGTWSLKTATVLSKSAAYTVAASDDGKVIPVDTSGGAVTLSFAAAATLGDGFRIEVRNEGSASNGVTLDPNGTETINGSTTLTLTDGQGAIVWSDGTNLRALVVPSAGAASQTFELIASATASSSSAIDFTGLSTTYQAYLLEFDGVVPATDNQHLVLRTSIDNGTTFNAGASDYQYASLGLNAGGTAGSVSSTGASSIRLTYAGQGNAAGEALSGSITLLNPADSGLRTQMLYRTAGVYWSAGEIIITTGAAERKAAEANNAIRLLFASGNISSGNFRLYGLRAS